MNPRHNNILKGIALLVTFCLMQVYVFAGSATTLTPAEPAAAINSQAGGTIKTTNNQSIIVNGNNVKPGTTILSGSTIETPPGVGATLQLGFAEVDIAPGTELIVEFTADGNVKVTLKRGCVILRTKGNSEGVIITPDGSSIKTGKDHRADVCFLEGATSPVVNQGAAANAGAGAGGGTGAAAGTSGGISSTLLAVLLAGGGGVILAVILASGGDNPSPSSP